ncbi:nuclease-related domain-containing protein [Bacillus salacetis]|uniref:nuclease-related domain-containing protein n=1 Tax=Bacillus salacetis TaxID=2315464 RepID=UPI001444619E|nr:nuclease-related domain-containing protein [Bacillus salacetis]
MIVKKRSVPVRIQQNEALLGRLDPCHPKRELIQEDLSKRAAGYKGECSVDYYLSFLSEKEYHIFHSLRLPPKDVHFQLDILLISPKRIILLEVKNISGTVVFGDPFNQLVRLKDDVETGFENPITQVRRQRFQLIKWLSKNNNFPLPLPLNIL